jgi:hypothetical protein
MSSILGNVLRIALFACGIGLSAAWTALLGFWIFKAFVSLI